VSNNHVKRYEWYDVEGSALGFAADLVLRQYSDMYVCLFCLMSDRCWELMSVNRKSYSWIQPQETHGRTPVAWYIKIYLRDD